MSDQTITQDQLNITTEENTITEDKDTMNLKNKKKRTMFRPEYYQCIADGEDSFYAVCESMRKVCKQVNTFITPIIEKKYDQDGYYIVDDIFEGLAQEIINNNCPKLIGKENIRTTINLTSNKIHIRLETNVAFKFEIQYSIREHQAYIDSCIGTIIMYSNDANLRNSIMMDGNWSRIFKQQ